MIRPLMLSAAIVALSFAPAANATEDGTQGHVEGAQELTSPEAMPVRLVSWDGDFELLKTSRRLRIWRSHISYRLTVDAEGNATDCELTETFRLRHVSLRLCDVLMENHTFQPAHDDSGVPTEGEYSSRISYAEVRNRL